MWEKARYAPDNPEAADDVLKRTESGEYIVDEFIEEDNLPDVWKFPILQKGNIATEGDEELRVYPQGIQEVRAANQRYEDQQEKSGILYSVSRVPYQIGRWVGKTTAKHPEHLSDAGYGTMRVTGWAMLASGATADAAGVGDGTVVSIAGLGVMAARHVLEGDHDVITENYVDKYLSDLSEDSGGKDLSVE